MRFDKLLVAGMLAVALGTAALPTMAVAASPPSPVPSATPIPFPSLAPTPAPLTPSSTDCGTNGAAPGSTGVNSLLPRPCIQQGNQANLSERYPADVYVWNVDPTSLAVGAVESGGIDPNTVWNGIAEGIFQGVVWIGSISSALLEWTFQVDLIGGASDLIGAVVGALGDHVYRALVEVMIVLGALWLIWHGLVRRRLTLTVEAMAWIVAALAMAGLYLAAPTAVVSFLNQESGSLATGLLGAVGGVDPTLHQANSQPVYGSGDRADAALRAAVDRYWTVYVYVPWEVGEFGSVQAGQQLGELELRARTTRQSADQQSFQDRLNSVELSSPSVKEWYNGNHGTERGVLALVALLTIAVASLLLLAVAAGVVVAQIGMIALAMLAPLFFTVGILPGTGRRILRRWAELELGFAVRRVLYAALLGVLLVLSSLVASAADSRGWFLAGAMQLLLILAVWAYRRPFMHIFGSVALPRSVAAHAARPQLAGLVYGALGHGQGLVERAQRRLVTGQAQQRTATPDQDDAAGRAGQRAQRAAARRGTRARRAAVTAAAATPQMRLAAGGLSAASKALRGAQWILRAGQAVKRTAEPLSEPLMVTGGFSRSVPLPSIQRRHGVPGGDATGSIESRRRRHSRHRGRRPAGTPERPVEEERHPIPRPHDRAPWRPQWRRRPRRRIWPDPYVASNEAPAYPEEVVEPTYPEPQPAPDYPEEVE